MKAIESVLQQAYRPIELIVVDDASTDNSRQVIEEAAKNHDIQCIYNQENLGNCTSFNLAFQQSKGKYSIDLAADDILMPARVQVGVHALEELGEKFGVHFCDVELIDDQKNSLGTHYKRNRQGQLMESVPEGDIYHHLVERYVISAPSMMIRREVLDLIGGYDEDLSYEDFDFWVRSARDFYYAFTDQILVKKLLLPTSLSSIQYKKNNRHALSTARVCEKILLLNQNEVENRALVKRINYELKWALITENWEASSIYIHLKQKLKAGNLRMVAEKIVLAVKPRWYPFWKILLK